MFFAACAAFMSRTTATTAMSVLVALRRRETTARAFSLLVDGHRMNDNVYEQAMIGFDFGLDAAMFERVEIVRGPSSSLYGTSAFFAVINVIMRKGAAQNGATVSAESRYVGTRSAHVAIGNRLANQIDYSLSVSYTGSEGPERLYVPAFDAPETNLGIAQRLDDEEVGQLFGRVKFAHYTLTGAFGHRAKGVATAPYVSAFNDPRALTTDRRRFIDGEYTRTIKGTQVVTSCVFRPLLLQQHFSYPTNRRRTGSGVSRLRHR